MPRNAKIAERLNPLVYAGKNGSSRACVLPAKARSLSDKERAWRAWAYQEMRDLKQRKGITIYGS